MQLINRLPTLKQCSPVNCWKNRLLAGYLLILCIITSGCKKLLEVQVPPTETTPGTIFTSDLNATSTVIGIYGDMMNGQGFASGATRSITFLSALSADELENYSSLTVPREFYENSLNTNNDAIEHQLWDEGYKYIYAANALMEGLALSTANVSPDVQKQLQGEALFIRAFCHFYLTNLFGDIPYLKTTDYQKNITSYRQPVSTVYENIIADLQQAQTLLREEYVAIQPTTARVRPNKWAATALLARVYLYTGNWEQAAALSTTVINQGIYQLEDSLNNVFLKTSREAIWQLMPNNPGVNTWEGRNFILTQAPATEEFNSTVLSRYMLQAFEAGDRRRRNWVDSIALGASQVYYFAYKYKKKVDADITEYSMVLRFAEQYLIRAEARAHLDNPQGAINDLNYIRERAGLPAMNVMNNDDILKAIAHERQVELFTEWGHRWLDLKRTGQANAILNNEKGTNWQPTDTLYPIPQNERALNQNLTQNKGYN